MLSSCPVRRSPPLLVFGLIVTLLAPSSANLVFAQDGKQENRSDADDIAISAVQTRLEGGPSFQTPEMRSMLESCARTRRFDALLVLISALSVSEDPSNSDEKRSKEQMLPAICLIKSNYGSAAGPELFARGIEATNDWMRNRIAFACRCVLPADQLARLRVLFSLDSSGHEAAKRFAAALASEDLDLAFDLPRKRESRSLDDAIKKAREQSESQSEK